ncbi:hypothetical protein RFI_15912 [Reticulomyxa filosa]|uniref:Uncharacterized protein n=1 Tax=Reticulomyxa filosa TaxID=46433 RepID=X6N7K4_RETFI|nr:hypothetical protein RFI_15912 [Reticulomyxa filosa]|eukprot:ETO21292.1 hypothetical protein RFI_15912 [Reticulomyxa filosa]
MKSLLVLVVVHVLNELMALLHANKTNASSCSWTSGQTHFHRHGRMNILLILCDILAKHSANYMWKLQTWKYDQCPQVYINVASVSSVQISNSGQMPLENEIIRILQSNFVTSPNQSNSNFIIKTLAKNNFMSTSSLLSTTYKLTFKQAPFRIYLKKNKNNRLLKICKIEDQVWIGGYVFDQLFFAQGGNKQEDNHQHYPQPWQTCFQYHIIQSSETCSKQNFKSKSYFAISSTILYNAAMLSSFTIFFCLKK